MKIMIAVAVAASLIQCKRQAQNSQSKDYAIVQEDGAVLYYLDKDTVYKKRCADKVLRSCGGEVLDEMTLVEYEKRLQAKLGVTMDFREAYLGNEQVLAEAVDSIIRSEKGSEERNQARANHRQALEKQKQLLANKNGFLYINTMAVLEHIPDFEGGIVPYKNIQTLNASDQRQFETTVDWPFFQRADEIRKKKEEAIAAAEALKAAQEAAKRAAERKKEQDRLAAIAAAEAEAEAERQRIAAEEERKRQEALIKEADENFASYLAMATEQWQDLDSRAAATLKTMEETFPYICDYKCGTQTYEICEIGDVGERQTGQWQKVSTGSVKDQIDMDNIRCSGLACLEKMVKKQCSSDVTSGSHTNRAGRKCFTVKQLSFLGGGCQIEGRRDSYRELTFETGGGLPEYLNEDSIFPRIASLSTTVFYKDLGGSWAQGCGGSFHSDTSGLKADSLSYTGVFRFHDGYGRVCHRDLSLGENVREINFECRGIISRHDSGLLTECFEQGKEDRSDRLELDIHMRSRSTTCVELYRKGRSPRFKIWGQCAHGSSFHKINPNVNLK